MDFREICRAQLKVDEGVHAKLYRDSLGIWSIGVGRNLQEKGLRSDEIDLLLSNDMADAELDARALVRGFDDLSENRKAVLLNLSFNMGKARLSGFVKMLAAVAAGDFNRAADEMMSSKWSQQVGQRAQRLAQMMRNG